VQDPDPRTLSGALQGDLGAFEDLVRLYQVEVWRYAYHLTGNRATAEDVTQETFLRAFRFLGSFRGEAKFSSWLLRIARNCSMDALRRSRDIPTPERAPIVATTPDPSLRAELLSAVRALSSGHREPFVLVEVFGLSYQEAADVLQVRVGTVKSRMHRARQVLIRHLTDEEAVDEA